MKCENQNCNEDTCVIYLCPAGKLCSSCYDKVRGSWSKKDHKRWARNYDNWIKKNKNRHDG